MNSVRNPEHVIDRQRRQIAQLREQVEELTEELRQLRTVVSTEPLPEWLPHLTPTEERLLLAFRDSRLPVASNVDLFNVMYGETPENRVPDVKMVDIYIHKLRKKLVGTSIVIITVHWRGHYLSKASKDLLNGVNLPVMNGVHAGASIQ